MSTTTKEKATAGAGGGVGRVRGVALYLASLLGAGLLALPALAFRAAGPASLVCWLVLVVISVPVALTFAALGGERADAGGVQAYAKAAFGDSVGAAAGLCFVLALPFGAPAAALVGAEYVVRAFGWASDTRVVVAGVILVMSGLSAAAGAKLAGGVQVALAVSLVVILVAACVAAIPHAQVHRGGPWLPHGIAGLTRAAGLLFFSFAGWEAVTPLAQEFHDPRRDTRVVAIWTLVLVAVLYLGLAAACVFSLGDRMNVDAAPVETLLAGLWSGGASWLTGVMAIVLVYGTTSAYMSGAASMMSALARDGWLPESLAAGHEVGAVPRRAAGLIGMLAIMMLVAFHLLGASLSGVMTLASAMFITVTLIGLLAGVKLLEGRGHHCVATSACVVMAVVLLACGWAAIYPAATILVVLVIGHFRHAGTRNHHA